MLSFLYLFINIVILLLLSSYFIENFINDIKYIMNMDPNNYNVIEDFVKSLSKANDVITNENPDIIIAPMFGSIPFIDVMNIINSDFPNDKVRYVPASNKVYRLRNVIRAVFKNLIEDETPEGGYFLSIDEVVSGNSLCRVHKQFNAAAMQYANSKILGTYSQNVDFTKENIKNSRDEIYNSIKYKSIGIVDSKLKRKNIPLNDSYKELVEKGVVIQIPTQQIVTMDRPGFFPARYKEVRDSENNTVYLPVVDQFTVSSEYIDFLNRVAEILGKPSVVTLSNMGNIRNSYKFVPENLRKL